MNEVQKYMSLDEVVKKQTALPGAGLFNHMEWFFDGLIPTVLAQMNKEQVITEDIDCEIIEPKQLPEAKTSTL